MAVRYVFGLVLVCVLQLVSGIVSAEPGGDSFRHFSIDRTIQVSSAGNASTLRLANPRDDGVTEVHLIVGQVHADRPDYWQLQVVDERPQGDPWGPEGLVVGLDMLQSVEQWTSPPLLGNAFTIRLRSRNTSPHEDVGSASVAILGASGPRPSSAVPQAPVNAFFSWIQLQEFSSLDKNAISNAGASVVSLLFRGDIFCSGVAVGGNLIATAAHCLSPPREFTRNGRCDDVAIVVGYVVEEASEARQSRAICEHVEVVSCAYDECEGRLGHADAGDLAILKVRGTRPLKAMKLAETGIFDYAKRVDVWIIGNLRPSISPQLEFYRCDAEPLQERTGRIALLRGELHFDHRCWTYGGASGAPVIRLGDGFKVELVGIHNGWDPGRFDCSDAFQSCQTGQPRSDPEPYFRNSASFSSSLLQIMNKD